MVYIGVTKRKLAKRWYEHCTQRHCLRLRHAIQKHGREAFAIIQLASAPDAEAASATEVALIAQWGTLSPAGFNLTTGGEGAFERTEETKARMSKAITGRKLSPEVKAKISASHMGKQLTAEHRVKVGRPGVPQSPELRAKRAAAQIGRVMTAETRAKISAAKTGRKMAARSLAYRANLSAAVKQWWAQRKEANNG
jgi:group I intron endonuclease